MKSKSFQQYEAAYSGYCEKIGSKGSEEKIISKIAEFPVASAMKLIAV